MLFLSKLFKTFDWYDDTEEFFTKIMPDKETRIAGTRYKVLLSERPMRESPNSVIIPIIKRWNAIPFLS